MLDFAAVRKKEKRFGELIDGLDRQELANLTNEMVDVMLGAISDCVDADVTFIPDDPEAEDSYASDPAEVNMPWTLGHVIVHTTASAEESAFLAAELARGVEFHGRSRSEVPWRRVTTIAQCRHRLEESRRMRLASLEMWPDEPYLDNAYQSRPGATPINAIRRFVYGLSHDDSHLAQIADIVQQAKAARLA